MVVVDTVVEAYDSIVCKIYFQGTFRQRNTGTHVVTNASIKLAISHTRLASGR